MIDDADPFVLYVVARNGDSVPLRGNGSMPLPCVYDLTREPDVEECLAQTPLFPERVEQETPRREFQES